jgi:hypothetical protein
MGTPAPGQPGERGLRVQCATGTVPVCPRVPKVNGLLDFRRSEETRRMAGPQTTPGEPVKTPEPGKPPEREPPTRAPPQIEPPTRAPPEIEPPAPPDIKPPGIHDPPMPTQPGKPEIIA